MEHNYKAKIEVRRAEADGEYTARIDLRLNGNVTSALVIDAPITVNGMLDFHNSHYSVGGGRFPYDIKRAQAGVLDTMVSKYHENIQAGFKKGVPFTRTFRFEADDGRPCGAEREVGTRTGRSGTGRAYGSGIISGSRIDNR